MNCYFKKIENKYNPLLSFKRPVVIRAKIKIDAKDVRLNSGNINEIDFIVRKITRDISTEYKCLAFSTFNEINIVLNNPELLINSNKLESHDIVSLFSQEIFMRYNELTFSKKRNFVSVNAFNIFEDKIKSYLYSRQSSGFNNYVSLLGAKLFSPNQVKNKNREEILDIIESIRPSMKFLKKQIKEGYMIANGQEIELCKLNSLNDIKVDSNIKNDVHIVSLHEDIEEDL